MNGTFFGLSVKLLICFTSIALFGFACDESSTDPTDDDTPSMGKLVVIAKDVQSVMVYFPSTKLGTRQAYRVSYRALTPGDDGIDSGTVVVGDFDNDERDLSVEIYGLEPRIYEFTLSIVTTDYKTLAPYSKGHGAPARRVTYSPGSFGQPIRLYERNSVVSNGLILSPEFDGPILTMVDDAPDGSVDFVLIVTPHPTDASRLDVDLTLAGVALANVPNSKIAFSTVLGSSEDISPVEILLDRYEVSYETYVNFQVVPGRNSISLQSQTHPANTIFKPRGFYCRIGSVDAGTQRFVRLVVMVDGEGKILQGTAPNRYIELEASVGYPVIPFA